MSGISLCSRPRGYILYTPKHEGRKFDAPSPVLMRDLGFKSPDRAETTISVVIPLLDERATIEELYSRLTVVLKAIPGEYEIIFVDDGSIDGSIEVLKGIRSHDDRVRYLRFRRNFGKSAALAAGFRTSRFNTIITMDADLQDLPEQLALLLSKLNEGYDLVSGWRYERRDKWTRRAASAVYNWITSRLTGVRLHDINCGFKCYRREVLDEVMIYGERHRFIPVLASYRGFRLTEVKIEHAPRVHGSSRYGLERVFGGMFSLLTVILMTRYTNKPLHFFGVMGLCLVSVGTAIDLYLIGARILAREWLSNRPLLIIGTLLIAVGVQFILFGLLAEMIAFSYRRDTDYSVVESSENETLQEPVPLRRATKLEAD